MLTHIDKRTIVDAAFTTFDSTLQLDPVEYAQAHATRHRVVNPIQAQGLLSDSFIQGSFGRKTMLSPLRDLDIVVILNAETASDPEYASARRAMELVASVLASAFPGSIDPDDSPARAIKLSLAGLDFTVDVVVARATSDPMIVELADRESNQWEQSSTKRLAKLVQDRNVATDGEFVRRVRMLKASKDGSAVLLRDGHQPNVSGILVESLAFDVLLTLGSPQEDILRVLQHGAQAVAGSVFDPTGDDDLTRKWSPYDHRIFVTEFGRLAGVARHAIELEASGQEAAAVAEWASILGDWFPENESRTTSAAARDWSFAGLGAGSAIAATPTTASTSIPRTKAYRP